MSPKRLQTCAACGRRFQFLSHDRQEGEAPICLECWYDRRNVAEKARMRAYQRWDDRHWRKKKT